jgi:O-antigen/teichoic acid export membrane protein
MAADVAREQSDDRSLMRHQQRTMLVSAGVALINLVVLFAIPDSLGRAVLGNVWPVLAPLLLPVSLWLIAAAAQAGAPPALIGRRQFQTAMVVQIVGGLLNVTALVGGAVIAGVEGAVWGLVVGQLAMAACWWFGLVRYLRRRRVPEPTQAASEE